MRATLPVALLVLGYFGVMALNALWRDQPRTYGLASMALTRSAVAVGIWWAVRPPRD